MKIKLLGKNLEDIIPKLKAANYSFCKDNENPELVITYGGDGALLGAERDFPNIPKLPLRDARTAPLCSKHEDYKQLQEYQNGELKKQKLSKIECIHKDGKLLALNDIFLHNLDRRSALRYSVYIDGKLYAKEVIGDGVGLATPHGSTAYYRSITHSVFRVGLGLAFSNSTEVVNHLVLSEESEIKIEVIRGPGLLVADNSPVEKIIMENDSVIFKCAEKFATIYGLEEFMCPHCRALRHAKKIY